MTGGPSTREEIVAAASAVVADLDLGHVKEWLAADPSRKACGYLPVYAPREVILAAGMLPVGIHGGGDRLEIIRGDAYYQSYICHLPRSVIELGLTGRLDCLSALLFPSTCDVIRNLSGVWQVIRPDLYVRYLDLPQVPDVEAATAFWSEELRTLYRGLCAVTGRQPSDDALREAIATCDALRGRIRRLYDARRDAPWQVPTEELYQLLRAAEQIPPETAIAWIDAYLAAIDAEPRPRRDNVRVVVAGAFCEQPPLGLIKTLERAGCYVVDDDLLVGNRMIVGDVGPSDDPVDALARALVTRHEASPIFYEGDPAGKRALMARRVQAARAEGVVFAAPSFCDPALLDRPMLKAGAEAAGIPCIAFQYSENTGQFQTYREQAGTFSDAIKLWGGA